MFGLFGTSKAKPVEGTDPGIAPSLIKALKQLDERGSFEGVLGADDGFTMQSGVGGRQIGPHLSCRMKAATAPDLFVLGAAGIDAGALQQTVDRALISVFGIDAEWKSSGQTDVSRFAVLPRGDKELNIKVVRADDIGVSETPVPGTQVQITVVHGTPDEIAARRAAQKAEQNDIRNQLVTAHLSQLALHLVADPTASFLPAIEGLSGMTRQGTNQFGDAVFVDPQAGVYMGVRPGQVEVSYVVDPPELAQAVASKALEFLGGTVSDYVKDGDTNRATASPAVGETVFDVAVAPDQSPFNDADGAPVMGAKIVITRRSEGDGPAPADTSKDAVPEATLAVVEVGEVLARLFRRLETSGTFIGTFSGQPEFQTMTTPEQIEVAADPNRQIGAVLDRPSFALMIGGMSVPIAALSPVSVIVKEISGTEPDWDVSDPNAMKATVQMGPKITADITVRGDDIQPWFDGRTIPGVTILTALKQSES